MAEPEDSDPSAFPVGNESARRRTWTADTLASAADGQYWAALQGASAMPMGSSKDVLLVNTVDTARCAGIPRVFSNARHSSSRKDMERKPKQQPRALDLLHQPDKERLQAF